MKTKSIAYQVRRELHEQVAFGESKHTVKEDIGNYNGKIFSKSTYKAYERECIQFGNWCKQNYGIKSIIADRQYVEQYLKWNMECGYSPWTVRLRASALAKLFRCSTTDFDIDLPKRDRTEIKRSRYTARGFSETRNQRVINFCLGTGLRRHELLKLKPENFVISEGKAFVYVEKGKGGKSRFIFVLPQYLDMVKACFEEARKAERKTVFEKSEIKIRMPVHKYRAIYAQSYYKQICRPIEKICREERYYCRKDKAGIVYDKKALLVVSRSLGHNRCDVVVTNYLY